MQSGGHSRADDYYRFLSGAKQHTHYPVPHPRASFPLSSHLHVHRVRAKIQAIIFPRVSRCPSALVVQAKNKISCSTGNKEQVPCIGGDASSSHRSRKPSFPRVTLVIPPSPEMPRLNQKPDKGATIPSEHFVMLTIRHSATLSLTNSSNSLHMLRILRRT